MKILLDARPALGGMARYVAALASSLAAELPPDSVRLFGREALSWGGKPSARRPRRVPLRPVAGIALRLWQDRVALGRQAVPERADVFHATFGVVPAGLRIPTIVTLHDLWALHHLEERPPGWRSRYERNALEKGLRRSAHVFTVSHSIARELVESMNWDPSRVTPLYPLLPPPADPDPGTPHRLRIPGRFLLSVGTLEPRKNQERLVAAQVAAFKHTGVPMVLAGAPGWQNGALLRTIAAAGPAVLGTGYVTDGELAWLYAHAAAVVQFSRYEGFDYPVAEALRAGRPLVLSDIEVHREIAGPAAVYAAPDDPAALAEALVATAEASGMPLATIAERARSRFAERFPPDAVQRYLDGYRQALAAGPCPG